nr:immunoglobulin heavy chain junction region [Macaca mulatta]MOV53819.1 immunoglobulin heavy chain junction region [Macaca mulatta]MOV54052.1 immunoglobulin heavy chain junction region [Macaca mulatta]MOV54112.1 immunoglobulin heavy chain junction region [Macaca mulatta]MOV54129.1 immunoglobulin heavy chain junction region [Macaca mulatta]
CAREVGSYEDDYGEFLGAFDFW